MRSRMKILVQALLKADLAGDHDRIRRIHDLIRRDYKLTMAKGIGSVKRVA